MIWGLGNSKKFYVGVMDVIDFYIIVWSVKAVGLIPFWHIWLNGSLLSLYLSAMCSSKLLDYAVNYFLFFYEQKDSYLQTYRH